MSEQKQQSQKNVISAFWIFTVLVIVVIAFGFGLYFNTYSSKRINPLQQKQRCLMALKMKKVNFKLRLTKLVYPKQNVDIICHPVKLLNTQQIIL